MNTFVHTCHSPELCRCNGVGGHNLPAVSRKTFARGGPDPVETRCRPRQELLPVMGPGAAGLTKAQLRGRIAMNKYIAENRL